MAESGAVRQRRYLAHRAGDHSQCKRCAALRPPVVAAGAAEPVSDPEGGLRELAGHLARAYRDQPSNALLARELRMTLQALLPQGGKGAVDSDIEDLFAELRSS